MTTYDVLAPVYGIWAALTETAAHGRAMAVLREHRFAKLLEVATGTGTEFAELAADPDRWLCAGVDLSRSMLKRARRRIQAKAGARALLCQADARTLPFRDQSFDCILSCYLLDLLPEEEAPLVLQEFRRLLPNQGTLVLAIMAPQTPIVQQVWMMLFRVFPALVGGCRPIPAADWLRNSGWDLERRELITQNGFRSEILVARVRTV